MNKKQILALFVCSLVPWTVGNGLVPLLPVYAIQLGADAALAGYYLAFSYCALAAGAISAAWVADKLHSFKKPLLAAGLLGIPIAWLTGRVENIWELTLLTAMLWFCGGLGMALITILAGLSAGKDERGKIFGIVSITGGLGALIGGLATGYIVDHWGFPTMFSVVALFLILWPLSVLFLTDKKIARTQQKDRQPKETPGLGKNYSLLFTASLLSNSASFFIILGRSLVMGKLEFGAAEIASTGAVGGGVGMLLPLLMGWLSDRTERKIFLYLGNLAGIISLSILAFSTSLWHFWIVIVIQSIFISTNATIGNALVTDLAHPTALAKGLSLFSATGWIGGVIGFAGAGTAFQALGVLPTFFLGVGLILAAIGLLIPIRKA